MDASKPITRTCILLPDRAETVPLCRVVPAGGVSREEIAGEQACWRCALKVRAETQPHEELATRGATTRGARKAGGRLPLPMLAAVSLPC